MHLLVSVLMIAGYYESNYLPAYHEPQKLCQIISLSRIHVCVRPKHSCIPNFGN